MCVRRGRSQCSYGISELRGGATEISLFGLHDGGKPQRISSTLCICVD